MKPCHLHARPSYLKIEITNLVITVTKSAVDHKKSYCLSETWLYELSCLTNSELISASITLTKRDKRRIGRYFERSEVSSDFLKTETTEEEFYNAGLFKKCCLDYFKDLQFNKWLSASV